VNDILKIQNDPFTIMLTAFSQLWPDKICEIEFSKDIPKPAIDDLDERNLNGAAGATRFKEGKIPLILLSPDLTFL
jgi:hypothetical protein